MGWRDWFGSNAQTTEDLVAQAEAARPVTPAQASSDPLDQITALVHAGEMIEAIKLHREQYGTSLVDAKEAIDSIARGYATAPPQQVHNDPTTTATDAQVRTLADAGELIPAIKLYREIHGVGLKEAKDAVDAMRA